MKITIKSKDLKDAIKACTAVLQYSGKQEVRPCILRATEQGLEIETARNGAMITKTMPGQLFRAGEVGIDLAVLADIKALGPDCTLDAQADKIKITSGRSSFQLPLYDRAVEDIAANRVDQHDVGAKAKLPIAALQAAVELAAFSSTEDFRIQIKIEKGRLRCAGIDFVSGGRVVVANDEVLANKPFEFVVPADLFSKVVESMQGKVLKVQLAQGSGVVLMQCDNMKVAHPILDRACVPIDDVMGDLVAQTATVSATMECQVLREAVDAVAPAAKGAGTAVLTVLKGKVKMSAADTSLAAQHLVKTTEVQGDDCVGHVHYQQLAEISKRIPSSVSVTLALYDKFLYVVANAKPMDIDYVVQQREP